MANRFANLAPKDVLTHFRMFIDDARDVSGVAGHIGDVDSLGGENRGGVYGELALHGFISNFNPPEFMFRDVNIPNHGDGSQFVDIGLEDMNLELSSKRYSANFGSLVRRFVTLKCYNAVRGTGPFAGLDESEERIPLLTTQWNWEIQGTVRRVNFGNVAPGADVPEIQIRMHAPVVKIFHKGIGDSVRYIIADIDTIQMKRIIAGFRRLPETASEDAKDKFDQLRDIRVALGLQDA